MEVTKIKYFPIERTSENHPLAACSITFDEVFMVHDVKIYGGGVVVMPQRSKQLNGFVKTNQHKSNDLCHPISKDFFETLKQEVLTGYALFEKLGERYYTPN